MDDKRNTMTMSFSYCGIERRDELGKCGKEYIALFF
jgi:hypothetical protein